MITFVEAYNKSIFSFFSLQQSSVNFSQLDGSIQKLADVIRGATDFVSIGSNDMSLYAYFSPDDQYVSLVHYYLNAQQNELLADVTPMTGNPPGGTPITANMKTYTIISNYKFSSSFNLFTYLDAYGNTLTMPISDEHIIKGVTITLEVPQNNPGTSGGQTMVLTVSLRNRKTNL